MSRGGVSVWLRGAGRRIAGGYHELARPPRMQVERIALRGITIWAIATLAVLLAVAFALDARAIIAARSLPQNVIDFFNFITDFGKSGWLLWPLAIIIALLVLAPPHLPRQAEMIFASLMARAGFLFLAIAVPGLFGTFIKNLVGRARPFVGDSANPFLFSPFSFTPAYESFPSGHTNTVFAALIAFGALFPRLRPLLWIYALTIALSRIIITAHHPSDVLGGALIGACGAILVRNYFAGRGLVFGVTPSGRAAAFPGPSWRRVKSAMHAVFAN